MSEDQMLQKILHSVLGTEASQEQMMERLDSIDKKLSGLELKMSRVEKWVSLENADFEPRAGRG